LVDFEYPVGMEIVELAMDLDYLLETQVDIVSRKAIEKSQKFEYILKDLIYV
jgi:predicted nucleotidyltransferase